MRIIKFRIWDKDFKKMRICGTNIHDSIHFMDFEDGNENVACYYNLQNGCGSLPDGGGTYELMQFTGLRDKNGREIYEGDIFKKDTDSKFVVYFGENTACYRAKRHDGWHFDLQVLYPINDWEIIGNIYEHPHLLEGGASE